MKKIDLILMVVVGCLFSGQLWAQSYQWGVGLRAGDPTGLSVKRFMGSKALEFNIGQTHLWGYNAVREFERDYDDYRYLDSRFKSATSLQVRYLSFKPIEIEGRDKLSWYAGIGGQLRSTSVDYRYRYWVGPRNDDWRERWEAVNDIDLGVDFIGGLDFTFHDIPLSIFTDINLFVELIDSPLFLRLQGGGGVRYNF
ncbi:MAG: hypothetical protein ACLFUB_11630 [Cyclobacteriaceae bacterium]